MVWYSHLFKIFPSFVVIYTVTGFSIVNEAEVDVFMEFPCFFSDPMDDGNLISGSCSFSKSSLYVWKFLVHVLLEPSLKDSEHYRGGSDGKESTCNVGDLGSILGFGRSPGDGTATHSSILAWRIPWTEEPGRLQAMGFQRVGHD